MKKLKNLFFPPNNSPDYFKALDGLRGIAVLLVLLAHSSKAGMFFYKHLNFSFMGRIGVYLFFILSAYLLDRKISVALMEGKADSVFWKNYILRRFFRIYPMFLFALVFFFILNHSGFGIAINKFADIPYHLLLIKCESIFWSVAVEFKYYLISPFILLFCHRFLKWNFVFVSIFISILIIIPMICHYFYRLERTNLFGLLPVFLTGTFLAIAELLNRNKIINCTRIF